MLPPIEQSCVIVHARSIVSPNNLTRTLKRAFTHYNEKHCSQDFQLHQDKTKRPRSTLVTFAYYRHETRRRRQSVIPPVADSTGNWEWPPAPRHKHRDSRKFLFQNTQMASNGFKLLQNLSPDGTSVALCMIRRAQFGDAASRSKKFADKDKFATLIPTRAGEN